MRQLEDMVPHEYEFLIPMRDKLFPNLTDRERHYMNDHAKHDVEYHAKDIRE